MRDGVEDIAYRMDALSSNSMKSANPHSGFHRIEVAPTLDTSDCNPLKNQGGGGGGGVRVVRDRKNKRGGGGGGGPPHPGPAPARVRCARHQMTVCDPK